MGISTVPITRETAFTAVTQALDLIAKLDPRRMRRMRHDLHRIVIGRRPTSFSVIGRACYLDSTELSRSTGIVALSLVHEAVHARFARAGVLPSGRNAAREEVRCNREELAFLDRMEAAGWSSIPKLRSWLQDTRARDAERVVAVSFEPPAV